MNRTFKLFLIFLAIGFSRISYSQTTDLARIEYTYFPQSDSDNTLRRFRNFANFSLELNEKGAYLIPGIEYENTNLKYQGNETNSNNDLGGQKI